MLVWLVAEESALLSRRWLPSPCPHVASPWYVKGEGEQARGRGEESKKGFVVFSYKGRNSIRPGPHPDDLI